MQSKISTPAPARRRWLPLLAALVSAFALSGCATAVIGSITISQLSAIAGAASTATTGRGLQDHALSAITGQDCRLLEGIFRRNRRICEEPGSPATQNDFRGVVVLLLGSPDGGDAASSDAEPEVIFAGAASDYRPSLTRRNAHRGAAEVLPTLPVHMAALGRDRPAMRPGTHISIYDAGVVSSRLASTQPMIRPGSQVAVLMPTVTEERPVPNLGRTVWRTAQTNQPLSMETAGIVPTVFDWASAQPQPTIVAVRLASE